MGSGSSVLPDNIKIAFANYEANKSKPDKELLEIMLKSLHSIPNEADAGITQERVGKSEEACLEDTNAFLVACGKFQKGGSKANLSRAQALYNAGLNVNAVDSDGWSALHHAAGEGHASIVQFLIQSKADVDQKDPFGSTPLWVACFNDRRDCVKELLLAGADEKIIAKPEGEPPQTAALAARRNRHPGLADLVDAETSLRTRDVERVKAQRRGEMDMRDFNSSLRNVLDPAANNTSQHTHEDEAQELG